MSSNYNANFYKTLSLDPSADKAKIRDRFRELALQCHPDRVRAQKGIHEETIKAATAQFQAVSRAYEVLSSDERKQYDRWFYQSQFATGRRSNMSAAHQAPPGSFFRSSTAPSRRPRDTAGPFFNTQTPPTAKKSTSTKKASTANPRSRTKPTAPTSFPTGPKSSSASTPWSRTADPAPPPPNSKKFSLYGHHDESGTPGLYNHPQSSRLRGEHAPSSPAVKTDASNNSTSPTDSTTNDLNPSGSSAWSEWQQSSQQSQSSRWSPTTTPAATEAAKDAAARPASAATTATATHTSQTSERRRSTMSAKLAASTPTPMATSMNIPAPTPMNMPSPTNMPIPMEMSAWTKTPTSSTSSPEQRDPVGSSGPTQQPVRSGDATSSRPTANPRSAFGRSDNQKHSFNFTASSSGQPTGFVFAAGGVGLSPKPSNPPTTKIKVVKSAKVDSTESQNKSQHQPTVEDDADSISEITVDEFAPHSTSSRRPHKPAAPAPADEMEIDDDATTGRSRPSSSTADSPVRPDAINMASLSNAVPTKKSDPTSSIDGLAGDLKKALPFAAASMSNRPHWSRNSRPEHIRSMISALIRTLPHPPAGPGVPDSITPFSVRNYNGQLADYLVVWNQFATSIRFTLTETGLRAASATVQVAGTLTKSDRFGGGHDDDEDDEDEDEDEDDGNGNIRNNGAAAATAARLDEYTVLLERDQAVRTYWDVACQNHMDVLRLDREFRSRLRSTR